MDAAQVAGDHELAHQPHGVERHDRRLPQVLGGDRPKQGELLVAQRREIGVADEHRARREGVEARKAMQQCRLTRPRRAHDGGQPSGLELMEIPSQGPDFGRPFAVHLDGVDGPSGDRRGGRPAELRTAVIATSRLVESSSIERPTPAAESRPTSAYASAATSCATAPEEAEELLRT